MKSENDPSQLACLEALRNQQLNLEECIRDLLDILRSLPEGDSRDKLLDKISCLDVILEVMKKALDSF
jgi:hypothetical protein